MGKWWIKIKIKIEIKIKIKIKKAYYAIKWKKIKYN